MSGARLGLHCGHGQRCRSPRTLPLSYNNTLHINRVVWNWMWLVGVLPLGHWLGSHCCNGNSWSVVGKSFLLTIKLIFAFQLQPRNWLTLLWLPRWCRWCVLVSANENLLHSLHSHTQYIVHMNKEELRRNRCPKTAMSSDLGFSIMIRSPDSSPCSFGRDPLQQSQKMWLGTTSLNFCNCGWNKQQNDVNVLISNDLPVHVLGC